MDHRWDDEVRAEHLRRIERGRYGTARIDEDDESDAMRRDRIARSMASRANQSPWAIGEAHWNQRDLYTRGPEVDARGYARGPSVHPEIGSYAYPRYDVGHGEDTGPRSVKPSVYEREAWPWLNYDRFERGPKGYRRSDAMIYEDVCELLTYDGYLDASDIHVKVEGGEVTLDGKVPNRTHKRIAEVHAERVRGVVDVHNRLDIARDDKGDEGGDDGDDLTFAAPATTLLAF